jgi:hypothetical protein
MTKRLNDFGPNLSKHYSVQFGREAECYLYIY